MVVQSDFNNYTPGLKTINYQISFDIFLFPEQNTFLTIHIYTHHIWAGLNLDNLGKQDRISTYRLRQNKTFTHIATF